jgi:hypothetical protein
MILSLDLFYPLFDTKHGRETGFCEAPHHQHARKTLELPAKFSEIRRLKHFAKYISPRNAALQKQNAKSLVILRQCGTNCLVGQFPRIETGRSS